MANIPLHRQLACQRKKRYPNRKVAKSKRRQLRYGVALDVYFCPVCRGYHLGGKKRNV